MKEKFNTLISLKQMYTIYNKALMMELAGLLERSKFLQVILKRRILDINAKVDENCKEIEKLDKLLEEYREELREMLYVKFKPKYIKPINDYHHLLFLQSLLNEQGPPPLIVETPEYTVKINYSRLDVVNAGFRFKNCLRGSEFSFRIYSKDSIVVEVTDKVEKQKSFIFSVGGYIDIRGYSNQNLDFNIFSKFIDTAVNYDYLREFIEQIPTDIFDALVNRTIGGTNE